VDKDRKLNRSNGQKILAKDSPGESDILKAFVSSAAIGGGASKQQLAICSQPACLSH
jgi:hypothetical protein